MDDEEKFDNLLKNSKLTEKDADEIGHKIKGEMAKRFRKYFEKQKKVKVWKTSDLLKIVN